MAPSCDMDPPRAERLPPIVRFILGNAAVGAVLGGALAAALVYTDTYGLQSLIRNSSDPVTPVVMIIVGFATLIGGLYTGAAIMRLPERK